MNPSGGGESLTRRQWLARLFWSATAAVAAGVVAPLLGYFLGPLSRRRTEPRIRLGQVEEFPSDRPSKVEFARRRRDGWVVVEGREAAWVVRREGEILVFDPRCTHLGCAYHWDEQGKQFLCPCHNGVYDIEGRVVSGPPPRPLDVYRTRVEDGALYAVPKPQRRA